MITAAGLIDLLKTVPGETEVTWDDGGLYVIVPKKVLNHGLDRIVDLLDGDAAKYFQKAGE